MYSFLRFLPSQFLIFSIFLQKRPEILCSEKSAFETIAVVDVVAVVVVIVVVLPCNSAAVMVSSEQKHLR